MDAQELLLNDAEVQQLSRLWDDVSSFSDLMETLRVSPYVMAGKGSIPCNKCSILCVITVFCKCNKARK